MLFLFSLDAAECRHWLLDLARHIMGEGHEITFEVRPGPSRSDAALALVLALEQRLYHLEGPSPWAPLAPSRLPRLEAAPDVRFDLSRTSAEGLSLFLGATAGVANLPGAIMARAPLALSFRAGDGVAAAQGVPAVSDPDSLWRTLSEVTGRIAALALMAADGHAAQRPVLPPPPGAAHGRPLRFFVGAFIRKGLARLWPDRFRREHWRIGIRPRPASALSGEALNLNGFHWLDDDGARYFADPVLFEHEGRCFLFVEEYRYAEARGVIAYTEVLASGEIAFAPRTIIERKGHLSFPLLFTHEGAIYLMPENAAEGHVPLYRARHFPDDWEELGSLIDMPLHDATLMQTGGGFWLLGNIALLDGSCCDALVAYSAASPLGPFTPHPANPLLLDARYTRAGGSLLEEAGEPLRIVQDCCVGYGSFLRFCAIDVTPSGHVSLTDRGAWQPPPGIAGLHSYTRSARFEAVDILTARNWKPR